MEMTANAKAVAAATSHIGRPDLAKRVRHHIETAMPVTAGTSYTAKCASAMNNPLRPRAAVPQAAAVGPNSVSAVRAKAISASADRRTAISRAPGSPAAWYPSAAITGHTIGLPLMMSLS